MKSERSYISSSVNITFALPQSMILPKGFTFLFQKREGIVSIIYSCNQDLLSGYFVVDTVLGNTHSWTCTSNSSVVGEHCFVDVGR